MRTIEAVRRPGLEVAPDTTLRHAAEIMERSNVGALAVVEGDRLVGIVTDRDIVRRGVAKALDPTARIDGVMTAPVVTIDAGADVHDAFALFRVHAVRRLAVVSERRFVGMVTVDDLLVNLAGDLSDLARPVTAEVLFGHRDVPVPDAV